MMNRGKLAAVFSLILALIFAFGVSRKMHAQDSKNPYPSMAPLDQYLMPDREAEIALARTGAPESISRDAKVLVLGRHGYETAIEGKNGFVCVVDRAWMSPAESTEFWSPKVRGPICLNPPAVRFFLPIYYKRTEMALAGKSKAQIIEWTNAAYAKNELPPVEPGAMCYMMSKVAHLDDAGHNLAHLMFFTPPMDGATWGADLPGSPVILVQKAPPDAFNIFVVPVGKWSDGTPAPLPR
jgi:hypothetical protein